MICPRCQTENPEGAQFCGGCGRSLQTELLCPQCVHKNLQDFRFCNKCGATLTEQAPTPTPEAPPSPEPTSFAGDRY